MRQQRPRQLDYTKPLTQFDNVDAFSNLESSVEGYKVLEIINDFQQKAKIRRIPVPINESEKKPSEKVSNGEVEKPEIQQEFVKKKNNQTDYIRIAENQNLPRNDCYEATFEDIEFLQTKLSKKVKIDENESTIITNNASTSTSKVSTSIFEQIILAWEMESDKVEIIEFERAKTIVSERFDKEIVNYISELFDYWKKQREILGRPLLRKHSKPAPNDNNPLIAFRPREKEKIKTRRNIRNNDQENIDKFKQLKQELVNCKYMIECIKSRENLKADIWEATNILKFEQAKYEKDEKGKIDNVLVKQFQEKSKKNLEELKKIQKKQNLQAFKFIEDPQLPPETLYPQLQLTDNKYDVLCFLASVINEAEKYKISQEYLNTLIQVPEADAIDTIIKIPSLINNNINVSMPPANNQLFRNQIPEEKKETTSSIINKHITKHWHQKKSNSLKFKLCKRINRCKMLLVDRYFKADPTYPYKKLPQKFELNIASEQQFLLQQKWKRFSSIYEHSDSTEEEFSETVKSIKKTISNGFKNFLKSKSKMSTKNSQFQ